ncbi:MAG: purine-nucleoside phosphorylase [Verrucomicrobiales bacterium]
MVGVVIGSGLAGLVDAVRVESELSFAEAELPMPRVPGHRGRLLVSRFANTRLLIAQGRVHLYEGWSAQEVTACVRWMASNGATTLVLTNAAGCLNPSFRPGQWMMAGDHINLTCTSPLLGGARFLDMSDVYSPRLRQVFQALAMEKGIVLHEGVYAGVLGPQYETPAEVRMLRKLGADAVGMSTVLEAMQARALDLEVAAFSCLTNWGAGMTNQKLSHDEVVKHGQIATADLVKLLTAFCEGRVQK